MKSRNVRHLRAYFSLPIVTLSAAILVSCGGGGAGGNGGASSATTGTLSGTATKGPVSGGTVTAFAISNGAKGIQLGSAQTSSNGNFTMTVGAYSGPLMLQMHGGSYMDEATGTQMSMLDADDMFCVLPTISVSAGSAVAGIQITPLTSMAHSWAEHMSGGMTMPNIDTANSHVGAVYVGPGADIVMTHPIDPTVSGAANGASIEARNYGMMLAAMSQEAHDLGMSTSSSSMITAMQDDASDGIMNGMMGSDTINMGGMGGMGGMMGGSTMMTTAGTSQLATAMATFINGPMNHSGVTSINEMQSLMDQMTRMAAAGGHL